VALEKKNKSSSPSLFTQHSAAHHSLPQLTDGLSVCRTVFRTLWPLSLHFFFFFYLELTLTRVPVCQLIINVGHSLSLLSPCPHMVSFFNVNVNVEEGKGDVVG